MRAGGQNRVFPLCPRDKKKDRKWDKFVPNRLSLKIQGQKTAIFYPGFSQINQLGKMAILRTFHIAEGIMALKASCVDSLDTNFVSSTQKYCPCALQRNGGLQDEAQEKIEEDYCDAPHRI